MILATVLISASLALAPQDRNGGGSSGGITFRWRAVPY